jgi:uncharacterized membrane protein
LPYEGIGKCYNACSKGIDFYSERGNCTIVMNIKRIFGSILTILGIVGLIYGAILFVNTTGGTRDIRALITYSVLGLIFLISGLSVVRTIKDEA